MNIDLLKTTIALLVAGLFSANALTEDLAIDAQMPEFEPVRDVAPVYPQRAINRKISGYTLVKFNLDLNGRAENIEIVDSEPNKVFDIASRRAILRTTYDKQDAASVQGDTFYRMYVFELDNTSANTLAKSF